MNTEGFAGLDEELEREERKQESKVASFDEAKKKRKPFHVWTVGGEEHKLKLIASMVVKLEEKYRTNITNLIMAADGTPPLSTMLTIAQAAIAPWEHGTNIDKVYGLYNAWVEEGGNQQDFLSKIILPTMAVSGFFTESQVASLMKSIEEAESLS